MIERIQRTAAGGAVQVDLWLCVCERVTCGWSWVVPYSRGIPKACSRCKVRTWNADGERAPGAAVTAAPDLRQAPPAVTPTILDAFGPAAPASGSISRGKASSKPNAPAEATAGPPTRCHHGLTFCLQCRRSA